MNNSIFPCVWFDNNGTEAAGYYCGIFPDTQLVSDDGMVQMLSLNGQSLMFLTAGPQFKPNASISFLIANEDEQETERLYNRLAEGGISLMPLAEYPFSKRYGWVRDKYGITWQLYTGEKGHTDQYFTPTLMFIGTNNGKAKEAIGFYTSLFPNSSTEGILEYPEGGEDKPGNVQHAQFTINNFTMACMDSSLDHKFNFDEGISFQIITGRQEETDHYWNHFIKDGGAESMCGWCRDKYGVSWQVVPRQLLDYFRNADKDTAKRVQQAMLKMKKIIVADLDKAAGEK